MRGLGVAVAVSALALAGAARAAELKISDLKAYLFLEQAGKLSDDIIGGPALVDAPRGGAPGGDSATGILIDFTFAGDKNFAPKYATAIVDLVQTDRLGHDVVTHKAFTGFRFGDDGVEHKAIFLENATCAPLVISVRAGKTEKKARLDFSCAEVTAPN